MIPITKCNAAGIALIQEFEGCVLKAYKDQAGIWTIGYGSTSNVKPDMCITQEEAARRLLEDIGYAENVIINQVMAQINSNQFSALCSFVFNEGAGHLEKSSLRQLLNSGNVYAAADAFLLWDKVRGCVVPGLLRRRMAERALFLA